MQTTIGAFDADTNQVEVTFDHAGVTHIRRVNACVGEGGAYDHVATAQRVAEVAAGVAVKIEVGAIVNVPEPELPQDD